jgi:thaumarchaeosortase
LGFLQSIVPTYLSFNKEILDSIIYALDLQTGLKPQTLGNALAIYGPDGPFVMEVYWPSAGIHSIVIFSVVMFALFLKATVPWKRALLYLSLGIILTCSVNGMRITILSLYALDPDLNRSDWEQLHSTVGEMMFIPCILLYVAFVIRLEKRHSGVKRKDGFP